MVRKIRTEQNPISCVYYCCIPYMGPTNMMTPPDQDWKKGSAELLVLSLLEEDGWVSGRWVEKADQRRRRYYSLTPAGRKALRSKQKSWQDFVAIITQVTGIEHA